MLTESKEIISSTVTGPAAEELEVDAFEVQFIASDRPDADGWIPADVFTAGDAGSDSGVVGALVGTGTNHGVLAVGVNYRMFIRVAADAERPVVLCGRVRPT